MTRTRGNKWIDALLFATVFVITFAKLRIATPLGDLFLSDVTASAFVLAFLADRIWHRDWSISRTAAIVLAFFAAFVAVYLVAFYNLGTADDRDLYVKGMVKFGIHFAFLVAAVAYLARRSARLYWQTLGWFIAGFAVNAAYGLLQLAFVESGRGNLDERFLSRLHVYRTNALTLDPNHLGVMLVVPILILFPLYLRLERGHRLRTPAALLLGFFTFVELSTLSRSGLLGIAVGLAVLAIPYRHLFLKPRFVVPVAAFGLLLLAIVAQRESFFKTVFEARTQSNTVGVGTHLQFYSLIRPALEQHPFFGLGLNTFSTYYEFVTGRTNWGPHSFYVALLTETGIAGAVLFVAYLVYLFGQLGVLRRIGRGLAATGDAAAARVRPLAWGLLAALLGTMAANTFYLTMQMYYFFVFALLVVAAPAVFARR